MESDVLLVGGAAGGRTSRSVGWACFAHVKATKASIKLTGFDLDMPLAWAHQVPFLAGLRWYQKHGPKKKYVEVLAITADQTLARHGNSPLIRNQHEWADFVPFERSGFRLTWVYEPKTANEPVFEEAERARARISKPADSARTP